MDKDTHTQFKARVDRIHRQINYVFTQFLAGHGFYLRRTSTTTVTGLTWPNIFDCAAWVLETGSTKDYRARSANYRHTKNARERRKIESDRNYSAKRHGKQEEHERLRRKTNMQCTMYEIALRTTAFPVK